MAVVCVGPSGILGTQGRGGTVEWRALVGILCTTLSAWDSGVLNLKKTPNWQGCHGVSGAPCYPWDSRDTPKRSMGTLMANMCGHE